MPRIAGVDIPAEKRIEIALTYIYGVGRSRANEILEKAGVDPDIRSNQLQPDQIEILRKIIEKNYQVEGELRRVVNYNIKRLKDIGCYRGIRHIKGLPVRGQRTQTNARTKRGKRQTVGGSGKAKGLEKT